MFIRRITITERKIDWSISDGRVFDSAGEALAVIKAEDAVRAEAGQSCMTVITWEPTSKWGRAVVKVLTQEK